MLNPNELKHRRGQLVPTFLLALSTTVENRLLLGFCFDTSYLTSGLSLIFLYQQAEPWSCNPMYPDRGWFLYATSNLCAVPSGRRPETPVVLLTPNRYRVQ